MADDSFPQIELIEAALVVVEKFAGRLRGGDAEDHVRRAVVELRDAFGDRRAIEPPVERLLRGIHMLSATYAAGPRRDYRRDTVGLDRLLAAVTIELVPALRRVGFQV